MSSNTLSNAFSLRNRLIAVGVISMAGMATMMSVTSDAAFSDTTSNSGNTWNAGTVTLENDRTSAAFVADNIVPGYTESKCITVTSTSTVPVDVNMYTAGLVAGPLSSALEVNVVEGANGVNTNDLNTNRGTCTGFVADGPAIFTGTLAGFGAVTDYAADKGNATLDPQGSKQYMISVSLPANASDTLQTSATGIDFVWEAQSK